MKCPNSLTSKNCSAIIYYLKDNVTIMETKKWIFFFTVLSRLVTRKRTIMRCAQKSHFTTMIDSRSECFFAVFNPDMSAF